MTLVTCFLLQISKRSSLCRTCHAGPLRRLWWTHCVFAVGVEMVSGSYHLCLSRYSFVIVLLAAEIFLGSSPSRSIPGSTGSWCSLHPPVFSRSPGKQRRWWKRRWRGESPGFLFMLCQLSAHLLLNKPLLCSFSSPLCFVWFIFAFFCTHVRFYTVYPWFLNIFKRRLILFTLFHLFISYVAVI